MLFIFRDSDELPDSPSALQTQSWSINVDGDICFLTAWDGTCVPYQLYNMVGYDEAKFMDMLFVQIQEMQPTVDVLTAIERCKDYAQLTEQDDNQLELDMS
mgnify:CR=1 FL=1